MASLMGNSGDGEPSIRPAQIVYNYGSDHLLALAFGDGLDDGPLALDRNKRAAVEIVNVTPDLQFPIIVDKRALISQVHPDLRGLQLNILLGPAEHLLELLDRPVLAGTRDVEENLGIFRGILHTHAAVTLAPPGG